MSTAEAAPKAKRHASASKLAVRKAKADYWQKYQKLDLDAYDAEEDKAKASAAIAVLGKDPNFKNSQLREIAVREGFGRVSAGALVHMRKRLYKELYDKARTQSVLRHGTGRSIIKQRDVCMNILESDSRKLGVYGHAGDPFEATRKRSAKKKGPSASAAAPNGKSDEKEEEEEEEEEEEDAEGDESEEDKEEDETSDEDDAEYEPEAPPAKRRKTDKAAAASSSSSSSSSSSAAPNGTAADSAASAT